MTFFGVPILDWVLLLVLLGFGVEAYLTTRPESGEPKAIEPDPVRSEDTQTAPENREPR